MASEPVLLLKTQSGPNDAYLDLFSKPHPQSQPSARHFSPTFVPVLRHHFRDAELSRIRNLLQKRRISREQDAEFGGMIFTSQRAVEALASLVEEGMGSDPSWPHLDDVPFYSVGPATTRALSRIPSSSSKNNLSIHGSHTGTGDVLAPFILSHYASEIYPSRNPLPPLLFLVGETRRDIIPRTLMDPSLPDDKRIEVVEETVYGTGVMESFYDDFTSLLRSTEEKGYRRRWVVVFSPTGCDSMLRGMNLLDPSTGRYDGRERDGRTLVVTIGPTTTKHLRDELGFEADAQADKPSPEGVLEAILEYDSRQG